MEYQKNNSILLTENSLPVISPSQLRVSTWLTVVVVIVSVSVINIIYFMRLDRIVGQFSDDAFYIVLAKSIAEQGSYQLISSPIQGIQPSYPFGFPALLAMILRLMPLDAEHLWMLKGLSIFALNFLLIGVYIYCRKIKEYPVLISWLVSMMVTLTPAFVFLATSSLMSECVFTCFQLWAVVCLETALKNKRCKIVTIFTLLLLVSATFYTRSLGITLIVAVIIQLSRFRLWKAVTILIIGIVATSTMWVTYTKYAYPNYALRYNHGGNIVMGYLEQSTVKLAGVRESGNATTSDYIFRVTGNIKSIVGRDLVGLFIPATLRTEEKSGEEVLGLGGGTEGGRAIPFATGATFISLSLALLILFGFLTQLRKGLTSVEILVPLTIGLIVIWPWLTFRFILPLAPFLLCYFIDGTKFLMSWVNDRARREYDIYSVARISLFCFVFFFIFEHLRYINLLRTNPQAISAVNAGEYLDEACLWMRDNLPQGAIVASTNPAKVYLTAHHLSISGDLSQQSWNYWRTAGIRYLAVLRPQRSGPLEANAEKYKIIFATATAPSFHVIDLGDPAARESWEDFSAWCNEFERAQSAHN